jgi:hypothetical protein
MPVDLRSGIVRILAPDGTTAGMGFAVSDDGLIVTCSHVLQDEAAQQRGDPRPEMVRVVFVATAEEREADVDAACWRARDEGDIAILQLPDGLPEGTLALPLGSTAHTSGHRFRTRGFRGESERAGGGDILELVPVGSGQQALQLRSQEVTQGYSGAPVWDEQAQRVVGMVSDIAAPDEHGRGRDTAFATPSETLRAACMILTISEAADISVVDRARAGGPTSWDASMRNLRKVLAGLFPTVQDSRRIVDAAGLPSSHIAFDAAAITNWYHILTEAMKRQKVPAIIDAALEEYPESEELQLARQGQLLAATPKTRDSSQIQAGPVLAKGPDRPTLDLDWLKAFHRQQAEVAGEKYRPDLHVDLPISKDLVGIGLSQSIADEFGLLRKHLHKAIRHIGSPEFSDLEIEQAWQEIAEAVKAVSSPLGIDDSFSNALMRFDALETALSHLAPLVESLEFTCFRRRDDIEAGDPVARDDRAAIDHLNRLIYDCRSIRRPASALLEWLQESSTRAARRRLYFLTGSAGSGKTHLFLDSVHNALSENRPAAVLHGAQFSGELWTSICGQLGLDPLGKDVLLGAMDAAAQATGLDGGRFVIMVDAINETPVEGYWEGNLPVLRAAIANWPNLALAVSCRDTYGGCRPPKTTRPIRCGEPSWICGKGNRSRGQVLQPLWA